MLLWDLQFLRCKTWRFWGKRTPRANDPAGGLSLEGISLRDIWWYLNEWKRTSECYSSYQSPRVPYNLLLASILHLYVLVLSAHGKNHQPLPETQDLGEMHENAGGNSENWDAKPMLFPIKHASRACFLTLREVFLAQGCMLKVLRLDACWSF